MAQTTHLASFGPVTLVLTILLRYFIIYSNKELVSKEKRRKKLTNGPNDAFNVVWARYRN